MPLREIYQRAGKAHPGESKEEPIKAGSFCVLFVLFFDFRDCGFEGGVDGFVRSASGVCVVE